MENIKLVSMLDYVLQVEQENNFDTELLKKICKYAHFLRQPLELWMFVPVGEDGKVLEDPKEYKGDYDLELLQWEHAWDRVLFEGFEVVDTSKDDDGIPMVVKNKDCYAAYFEDGVWNLKRNETIESLIPYNLTLTENL